MKTVHIKAVVGWNVEKDKDTGWWVGHCPDLGLVAQGETFEDLGERIGNSITALMADLLQHNELSGFLASKGWEPSIPLPTRPEPMRIDLPWTSNIEGTQHGVPAYN